MQFEWIIIFICITLSGIFSGLTISLFGLGRLRLESEAGAGSIEAQKVLQLRSDSNFLLCTLLWGNVSVNTLLALMTESVMNGVFAFVFTTFFITFFGEIIPQAWFSRNALLVGSRLKPIVRLFQFIFYPLAKPSALLLDKWLGEEGLDFFSEESLKVFIDKHIESSSSEIEKLEGQGALNFLNLDDLRVSEEGEKISEKSIFKLPIKLDLPVFPDFNSGEGEAFIKSISSCKYKWLVFLDDEDRPILVMNSDAFLKRYYIEKELDPYLYCHRPLVIEEEFEVMANVINRLFVTKESEEDDVIDCDVVIFWHADNKKIITGSDILGRLLRGIVKVKHPKAQIKVT